MTQLGCDVDQMEALEQLLAQRAESLTQSIARIDATLNRLDWRGADGVAFTSNWRRQGRIAVNGAALLLRNISKEVSRNRLEQIAASDGKDIASGAAPLRPGWNAMGPKDISASAIALPGPGQDQLAWWSSLSPQARAALLNERPGELTGLGGLPPDVLAQARANYFDHIRGSIENHSTTIDGELKATIRIFDVGVGVQAEEHHYADGHVDVVLKGDTIGGVGVKDVASGDAKLGGGLKYTFDSQADADRFLRGLAAAPVPHSPRDYAELGLSPAGYAAVRIHDYLNGQGDHLESIIGHAGVQASVDGKGPSVDVADNVTAEYNVRTHQTTLRASEEISLKGDNGATQLQGKVEGSVQLTLDDQGAPKDVELELKLHGAQLGGVFSPAGNVGAGAVIDGSAKISLDLQDPQVRAAAGHIADCVRRGDVDGAIKALASVYEHAQIVVQQDVGVTSQAGFDAGVVAGSTSTTETSAANIWVKPPGGAMYQVPPGSFQYPTSPAPNGVGAGAGGTGSW